MGIKQILSSVPGLPRDLATTSFVTGDAAWWKAGVPLTMAQRLVDQGDNTVLDLATGLRWVKRPWQIIPGTTHGGTDPVKVSGGPLVWALGVSYTVGQFVTNETGTMFYVCYQAHTSSAQIEWGHWDYWAVFAVNYQGLL
jgi:hypothetical protein